ncbi:hypothetical protein [Massilia sp. LC238]|nr:hypothetical protein [Massilia sp. LC238]KFC73044.1 hypothetical protein FG94_01723 [Massilia sp. LC238]
MEKLISTVEGRNLVIKCIERFALIGGFMLSVTVLGAKLFDNIGL